MNTFSDLFTTQQLVALTTFSDLVSEVRDYVLADGRSAGLPDDGKGINDGGTGATAYADAVVTYLSFTVDKAADYWSSICSWHSGRDIVRNTFARQAQMPYKFLIISGLIFGGRSVNADSIFYAHIMEVEIGRRMILPETISSQTIFLMFVFPKFEPFLLISTHVLTTYTPYLT